MRMSRIILVLVALLAGGLAAFLAMNAGSGQPAEPAVTQVVAEAKDHVLVAATNVGIGQRLTQADVAWKEWPAGGTAGYINQTESPNAIQDMEGAVARFELFPGEPILQSKLVRSDQGYLSAVLDKGMRGISISVSADSASGGFIVPNDHVDVILSRGGPSGTQSETILSNVRVLAINTRLGETGTTGAPDDGGGDATADPKSQVFANTAIATLELDPGQAETVINATQLGKLSLALRSITDFSPESTDNTGVQRNAPIKIIRYGQEANVTAAAPPAANGDVAGVDTAAFHAPAVTVSPTVSPLD